MVEASPEQTVPGAAHALRKPGLRGADALEMQPVQTRTGALRIAVKTVSAPTGERAMHAGEGALRSRVF